MKSRKSLIYKKPLIYLIMLACANATLFSSVENFVPNSIGTLPTRLIFDKTIFDNTNFNLVLGAANQVYNIDSAKTYAITRTEGPTIIGLTPQNTLLPIIPPPAQGSSPYASGPNPLYGQVISNLGLFGNVYPIATWVQDPASATYNSVAMILQDGATTITTTGSLVDAGGAQTQEIKALTGSSKYIFAAVSATGRDWDDQTDAGYNRGIAVLLSTVTTTAAATISQIPAPTISVPTNAPKAQIVDVRTTAALVSFSDAADSATRTTQAFIGSDVDMYWDSVLGRLFIGLSKVHRDNSGDEGGCLSVLVGRIDIDTASGKDTAFNLSPILSSPSEDQFDLNSVNFMIGFYYNGKGPDGNKDITISAKKVRVMHTSTGYSYLIVNCDVTESVPNTYSGVFALPLIGKTLKGGTTPQDPKLIGTLAQKGNFYAAPTVPENMPQKDQIPVIVGNGTLNMPNLKDMFTRGDSVFVCLSDVDNPQNSGIFQSIALFDENGFITAWTPWQRVMGSVQNVYGGGVDKWSNFYFLASEKNPPDPLSLTPNTIRATEWGTTEGVNIDETIVLTGNTATITVNGASVTVPGTVAKWTSNTDKNLSAVLSNIFPQDQCGTLQIINFDERTPGFNADFSMMVAIGYNNVALIQTMNDGVPVPEFETSGENQNVFNFPNDPVLNAIAPLCFAEVARNRDADSGWLFVGGYKGVAVLSQADGNGWPSQNPGLSILQTGAFPDPTIYSFKQLNPTNGGDFSNVRKLASLVSSDGVRTLFIQTRDNLYAINQKDKAQFETGNVNEQEITFGGTLPESVKFTDLLIIPNADAPTPTSSTKYTFLFGSTYGLLIGSGYDGTKIQLINSGSATADPALQMCYLSSTKGLNSSLGNLYVLSANFLTSAGKITRYAIDGSQYAMANTVNPISVDANPFINLYNFRGDFITDGAFGFSMIARGPSSNFLTDLYQIAKTQTETGSIDELLGLTETNWYIGVMGRNTASGSWMVPGDWGVRVNE